jgi:hypothetical protein
MDAFKKNGEEFLEIYQKLCGLKPDERVLDVGSGIGRKTLPLTKPVLSCGLFYEIRPSKIGARMPLR